MARPKLGPGFLLQSSLWSGRQCALGNLLHCNLPMLNGFLPYRSPQGRCELRGALPNLWFGVVATLGCCVASIRFPEGPFNELFTSVCPEAAILPVVLHQCNTLPNVVFLDLLSVLLVSRLSNTYWRA